MKEMRHLRVVIVSPSDVAPERGAIQTVLHEINQGIAQDLRYQLDWYSWETDAYPQFHAEGPQGAVDSGLRIQESDIVIGLFWTRFGTPVSDARSGTEHELRTAYSEWKRDRRPKLPVIMLYFKTEPFTPRTVEDAEQMRRVLEFKASFAQEALYSDFDSTESFKQQLQKHLTQLLRASLDLNSSVERRVVAQETPANIKDDKSRQIDQIPLYTFCGLQRDTQVADIFQDFRVDPDRYRNPNPVTHLWADVYRGCAITAAVEEFVPPHLSITFENHLGSWPCNITLRPIEEKAVATNGKAVIAFEARVDTTSAAGTLQEVAVAVRVINGWCQHWSYGPTGRYRLLSTTASWQTFSVSLQPDKWWLFPSDGNHYFGPAYADFGIVAGVVLEFGSNNIHRAGPGRATIQIRNIHFQ